MRMKLHNLASNPRQASPHMALAGMSCMSTGMVSPPHGVLDGGTCEVVVEGTVSETESHHQAVGFALLIGIHIETHAEIWCRGVEHVVLGIAYTVTFSKAQFKDGEYLLADVQSACYLHLRESAAGSLHYKTHYIGTNTETSNEVYLLLLRSYPFLGARTSCRLHRVYGSSVRCGYGSWQNLLCRQLYACKEGQDYCYDNAITLHA